ncbi:MAG: CvpA family protein [Verrucomicrobiota bacterium]|nr:CvpA family protein [Limisphaera sp.]MDW8382667.1 CvpA family protein [Verrucomicrobiota bacterium]
MKLDAMPLHWFDLAVVTVLLLGIWRGQKNGMSGEALPLIKWLVIVLLAARLYEPIGRWLMANSPFGLLTCYLLGYVLSALAITALFSLGKRWLGGKLVSSDLFGKAEYYLGMGAGMVRFACVMLAGLALLNARLYTEAEIRATQRFQQDVYGSNFFPTLPMVQKEVFEGSLLGRKIREYCGDLLIRPTPPGGKDLRQARRQIPEV